MDGFRLCTKVSLLSVLVIGVLVGVASRVTAQIPGSLPSPTVQDPDLMPTLLAEVKAIRSDVGEAARISTAAQLLLGRAQLQLLQVTRLDQQLGLAAARRLDAIRARTATAARLRELERRRTERVSAEERSAIKAERRLLRTELQEQQSLEGQLRRQETELTQALSTEEERLRELIARLDALELAAH
jgi:hypothetical protein